MSPIRIRTTAFFAAVAAVVAGCSTSSPTRPEKGMGAAALAKRTPTTAETPLADLQPAVVLPEPASQPSAAAATQPAPLESLELFAQARRAMLDNRRYTAIALLEKAITIDPYSFELHYSLGRAYTQPGLGPEKAIAAYEQASAIAPSDVEARLQLARLYLTSSQSGKAIETLRIAMLTEEYKRGDDSAALVDLLLARALQQKGYYRAALDQYAILIDRLRHAGPTLRGNQELSYLANRPETLLNQIAQLEESLGNYDAACTAYTEALKTDTTNFELHSRLVKALLLTGRSSDAATQAAQTVRTFHASGESLDLLRDTYKQVGRSTGLGDELLRLHKANPSDRSLLYALADVLASGNDAARAEALLDEQLSPSHYDLELVRRLFHLYQSNGQTSDAAKLLIEAMAANPDSMREMSGMWDEILRFSQKNRLRLATLQKLEVSSTAQSAKLFWVARLAEIWNRDQLAKTSLEQAVKLAPPLAPAFRARIQQIWSDPDVAAETKARASQELIDSAALQKQPALSAELRGLMLLKQNKGAEAAAALDEAVKLGRPSIDLQVNYASALFQQNQAARGEQVLWRLISDNPTFDEPYEALFQFYLQTNSASQAIKVLSTWMTADPGSVNAKVVQANLFLQAKRTDAAEQMLLPLFELHPDDPEVLAVTRTLFESTNRLDQYALKLEDERVRHPQNRTAAEMLVRIYNLQKRSASAVRVVDAMKSSDPTDVDFLYYLSHLYNEVGQKETGEQTLQQCLKLDPAYSPAANDLGYSWADQGKNLKEAETLVKLAVEAEPDNQTYLDSLGWVMYKTNRYPDAVRYLKQAVDAAVRPDPVVLDHYGDALYRAGNRADAQAQWKRSDDSLADQPAGREDIQGLKLQLEQKLKQANGNQDVTVAPTGAAARQAKS